MLSVLALFAKSCDLLNPFLVANHSNPQLAARCNFRLESLLLFNKIVVPSLLTGVSFSVSHGFAMQHRKEGLLIYLHGTRYSSPNFI